MKRTIVGTAGHIDHGKTKLVEALTGIDCDRWAEEKRRGITIDLGFAHLETEDLQIGFVDVPGHERFIDNALAGLGGIRVMLLVVAADEGVMPQTREHLAICDLLEIPAALVALTKSDLVEQDELELAELEIRELLEDTAFADAEVIPVSSMTGKGIPELRGKLAGLAARFALEPDPTRPTRLPIDRIFALRGLGQIVTGTLTDGRIEPGDTLVALPGRFNVRVRSIQVHGTDRPRACKGERTALRLGGVESGSLTRGSQLVKRDAYRESRRILVRLKLLDDGAKPIEGNVPVRVHIATSEIHGRLYPLG
jgi:selenocysteine-specific elongation factor